MNGTAVMTALACLAYVRADYLARLATRITALASFALDGNAHHFDATLFSVKPHPGQQRTFDGPAQPAAFRALNRCERCMSDPCSGAGR